MMKHNVVLFMMILFLAACATAYQPMGFSGGYRDTHIKGDVYYVEIATNAYTDQITAVKYFHRRAKELCLENGYTDYSVGSEKDTSTQYAMGSYGSGSLTATTLNKPGISGYVVCVK